MFLHDFQEFKGLRFRFLAPSKKKRKHETSLNLIILKILVFRDFGINPLGLQTMTNMHVLAHLVSTWSILNLTEKEIETKMITIEIFNKSEAHFTLDGRTSMK